MISSAAALLHTADRILLRAVSCLVPAKQRSEWLREWYAELWHVREASTSPQFSWQDERVVLDFCLGAFADAQCLRQHPRPERTPRMQLSSASRALLGLAALTFASACVAMLLPGVRTALQPPPYRDPRNLVYLQSEDTLHGVQATTRPADFVYLAHKRQELFSSFAYYQVARETLHTPHTAVPFRIAHATPNLFETLGLPVCFFRNGKAESGLPQLIVTDQVWRRYLRRGAPMAGQTLLLGSRKVQLAGVIANGAWMAQGNADAWVLDSAIGRMPDRSGFVVARLRPEAQLHFDPRWRLVIPHDKGPSDHLVCIAFSDGLPDPLGTFLFSIVLATLALPAITSVSLGEFHLSPGSLTWRLRLRRGSLLVAKLALILPLVYLTSLSAAHWNPAMDIAPAQLTQGIVSFLVCLTAFYWALRDQRQRCPVCLRKLTHPARVGEPSRNFLAWNGTELICGGGHGLLHIPELPTSWFGHQRWLALDSSWSALFL